MKKLFVSVSLMLLTLQFSWGCTAFCVCFLNRAILAKNLDWPVDSGFILVNHSGITKTSFSTTGQSFSWSSRYSSITFNQFGKEFPLGGMNERGLVVEELNMPPVQAVPDLSKQVLNEFQLVQYLLDNYSSAREVEEALAHLQTVPLLLSLHYLVMDREGVALILEFNGSRFSVYSPGESGIPVLSNNLYEESLGYLAKFQGFGGNQELLNRPGSNERFVSVASMLKTMEAGEPVKHSFEILDAVAQPDTRWSIVYDATRLRIHVKFHACPNKQEISLPELLQSVGKFSLGAKVSDCNLGDIGSFRPFSKKHNSELVFGVMDLLGKELDLSSREALFKDLIHYSNTYVFE